MRRGAGRRALGATRFVLSGPLRVLAIAGLAIGTAGCAAQPGAQYAAAGAIPVSGVTIAFESIDGPPPEVFRRLVTSLNDEAQARRIPVVSREGAATYRVRGYVAASIEQGKTSFDWVWDIYDPEKRRTLRIAGEERVGTGRRRDAWAAADEAVVRRMASIRTSDRSS